MFLGQHLVRACGRHFSSVPKPRAVKPKPKVVLTDSVLQSLEKEEYKPRKHPGVNRNKTVQLPTVILKSIVRSTNDYPIKLLLFEGAALNRVLKGRHPPMEPEALQSKMRYFRDSFIERKQINLKAMDEEQRGIKERELQGNVTQLLKRKVYNWYPIKYDQFKAMQYLLVRSPAEFAVLSKIFTEIKARDPMFLPRGFFDFGSGVGSALWAVTDVWDKKNVFEYFVCDASKDMNDLSELVLRGGDDNKDLSYKNINYRQFLPAGNELKYELVVCAYTLFELNGAESRFNTLKTLWDKCNDYLVIVEHGTRAGFNLVMEARDFVLEYDKEATVFAPCPHTMKCPRIAAADGTPCNFVTNFMTTGIGAPQTVEKEVYSYVVLKKGQLNRAESDDWPRIVRPVLVRKKHSVCRMCTKEGALQEVVFSAKKHGKTAYHCARSSDWGDRLPIEIGSPVNEEAEDPEETQG